MIASIEAPFTFLQEPAEILLLDAIEAAQVTLGLVLCQLIILGYREVSFVRASSMVNCYLTPRWFWFVAVAHTLRFLRAEARCPRCDAP